MNRKLAAALVIARRDYVATVFSRAFLLFLIGPLFPVIFAVVFTTAGANDDSDPAPVVRVIAQGPLATSIVAAQARLANAAGGDIPRLLIERPRSDRAVQVRGLLRQSGHPMVLSGLPGAPVLTGPADAIDRYGHMTGLIVDDARRAMELDQAGLRPTPIAITFHAMAYPAAPDDGGRRSTAHGAQLILFLLTMILASMLLSNLIEEKSNKVIEILAAAVPVDAIFFGKLMGMLAMSLTAIAIWALGAVIGVFTFAPDMIAGLAAPAVGWPFMVLVGILYFIASYLLLGALFLGIGAQASSVREVQTLSLPVTMVQLGVFGLASAVVGKPDSALGIGAMIFPWSSPLAMMAHAAMRPTLWPHLLALLWQALWIALIIRLGARMFRRSVLKSGGAGRGAFRAIKDALRR